MSNESALFEDDFEFAEELDALSDGPELPPFEEPMAELEEAPQTDPPANDAVDLDGTFESPDEGGNQMVPAISIIVFHEREDTAEMLRVAAQDRRMSKATMELYPGGLEAAIAHASQHPTPHLIIVESASPAATMIAQIDELATHCEEGVEVLVVGAHNDIGLYRQLMARGVSEYLVPPVQPLSLIRSISTLFADPESPFIGKSIAVIGAKGGAGASTIAHNLAWSVTENGGLNATLVDLDLSFGTTALDFNQDNAQTVADALLAPERADEAVIGRLLSNATERLSLFTAPATVSSVMDIPPEAYDVVIEGVRRLVPYVILDLPHLWSSWMHRTLVGADEVVLVCKPDLATLRNTKNLVDQLKADRPNDAEPRLVMNMTGLPAEIPVKDFAAAIGLEPEVVLQFEPKLFGAAANNGQMLSEAQGDSKAAQSIDHLASVLTGRMVSQPSKSFVQKLLGK